MANCCCPDVADTSDRASRCPVSGTRGVAVPLETVKALLNARALTRFAAVEHWFCPDPSCDVVYFDMEGACFDRGDVRVAVWQKEPAGDRVICYCFEEREATIRGEIRTTGHSVAVDRVREHIAAKRCACDVRNPRGACCLGDLLSVVERIEAEEASAGGNTMKAAVGSVIAALAASACCIGPVVFSLMGVGALSVASTKIEPYRPWFLAATAVLLASAFYAAYQPVTQALCDTDACAPQSRRAVRVLVCNSSGDCTN